MTLPTGVGWLRNNNRRRLSEGCRAFSLVEIVLVVVLVAVIAGLAVPNYRRTFSRLALTETVQDIAYLMRFAQSRAIVRNTTVRMVFSDDRLDYWIEESAEEQLEEDSAGKGSGSPEKPADFQRISGRLGRKHRIPHGLTISFAVSAVIFYPDGNIDRTRIEICRRKDCLTVSTQEQRGYVRIIDEMDE